MVQGYGMELGLRFYGVGFRVGFRAFELEFGIKSRVSVLGFMARVGCLGSSFCVDFGVYVFGFGFELM